MHFSPSCPSGERERQPISTGGAGTDKRASFAGGLVRALEILGITEASIHTPGLRPVRPTIPTHAGSWASVSRSLRAYTHAERARAPPRAPSHWPRHAPTHAGEKTAPCAAPGGRRRCSRCCLSPACVGGLFAAQRSSRQNLRLTEQRPLGAMPQGSKTVGPSKRIWAPATTTRYAVHTPGSGSSLVNSRNNPGK